MKLTRLMLPFLMVVSMAAGCGQAVDSTAPALLEPKGSEIVYETVERRDVGSTKNAGDKVSYVAVAVPRDYCQFFEKNVKVDEILVQVGDYVHEGDVIATVDTEDIDMQIDMLQKERAYRVGSYELELEKAAYDRIVEECRHNTNVKAYQNDPSEYKKKDIEDMNGQISEFEEEQMLNEMLYSFNINAIDEEIARLREQLTNTVLYASHDGYVTYIKDMNASRETGPEENVAIIVDMDDTYLEIAQLNCQQKTFDQFDECFCEIDGVRYEVVESGFLPIEYQIMQSKRKYANVRVGIEGYNGTFAAGDSVEIVFRRNFAIHVLSVHRDCVYQDVTGNFVYVRENGEDVKRQVTVGNMDKNYAEIVAGLTEGEEVKREVNPLMVEDVIVPAGIREVPAESWKNSDFYEKKYFSRYEGIVDEILVESGQVEKGDPIFTIKTTGVKSEVVRLEKEIENNSYTLTQQNLACDQRIKTLDTMRYKQVIIPESGVLEALKDVEDEDTKGYLEEQAARLANERRSLDAQIASVEMEKRINAYNCQYNDSVLSAKLGKANRDVNGEGTINISAKQDGYINKLNLRPGKSIKVGDHLFTEKIDWENRIVVFAKEDLYIGQTVNIAKVDENYTGVIYGYAGSPDIKYHTTVRGDKVFVTGDTAKMPNRAYYVRMDDESAYQHLTQNFNCLVNLYKPEEVLANDKINTGKN